MCIRDTDEAVDALQHVFGIVGICPVMIYEEQGFEKLAEDVVSYMKQWHPDFNGTFKVWTRRAKTVSYTHLDVYKRQHRRVQESA